MNRRKGFTIIMVLAFIVIMIIIGVPLVDIGTSEMRQATIDANRMTAYYSAISGAERLWAKLKSKLNQDIDWASQGLTGNVTVGSAALATYNASVCSITYDSATKKGVLGIVSKGRAGTPASYSSVTVKYGYTADSYGPAPLSSLGNIELTAHLDDSGKKPKSNSISIDGPLQTGPGSTVTINEPTTLVTVNGGIEEGVTGMTPLSFWIKNDGTPGTRFDTKNTGVVFDDQGTGKVTEAQAIAQSGTTDHNDSKLKTFYMNDVNGDLVIDDKDAFIYYYTQYLDQAANNSTGADLSIAPGEVYYFSPALTPDSFKDHINSHGKNVKLLEVDDSIQLKKKAVSAGTAIIFVDGDLYINKTDTRWTNGAFQHTIVCTGEVAINQPTNGKDDTLTIVSLGDVTICGKDTGKSQLNGNFIVYTKGDFTALKGGSSNNAIFAEGNMTIDTYDANKKNDRTMNTLLGTWSPTLGLPPGYRTIVFNFKLDTSVAPTRWETTNS